MLLYGQNIKKEYGIQSVLDISKLSIEDGDRIGLVGRNGVGKSTLFGILSGRIECDEGVIKRNCEIAEILQSGETDGDADGSLRSRFSLKDSAVKSGGEKTRLAIASAFSKHAPLLFADEPTTNLDVKGIELLEKMLSGYRGAVVLISHDRELLDRVCNQIWELEDGELRIFQGNYTAWYEQRKRERDFEQFEYRQYVSEKKRLEKTITDVKQEAAKVAKPPKKMSSSEWMLYKGTASIQQGHVQGRASALISRLSHLEKKERPKDLPDVSMKLGDMSKIKAKVAAKAEEISISFGERSILENTSIAIETGKKTFLLGENGTGKSSLIKAILQGKEHTFVPKDAKIGYFSQEQENLNYEETVIENVVSTAVVPRHICRAVLANLYMKENDIEKKVRVLSGGERVKTAIAKVLVSGCNFLVLDEPTNHMDIYTMEGLEQLLSSYDGTLFVISHDRKLVENLADIVYEISDQKIHKVEL